MDVSTTVKPIPFPVARFVHYGDFRYYYAYGNTPAEDFLQNAHGLSTPNVLLLGCGDMRSCFYTIWKNFRSGVNRQFDGVHFVLNDCSSAIIARDILFVHLCLKMPQETAAMKKWISALWAIWFCHELLPDHKQVLDDGLRELIELSESPAAWSSTSNSLNKLINFSSPDTFRAVRQTWIMWHNKEVNVRTVKQMSDDRLALQNQKLNMLSVATVITHASCDVRNTSQKTTDLMKDEIVQYFKTGNAFAEDAFGAPILTGSTDINLTFYERKDGKYSLHYESVPFRSFFHLFQFSQKDMSSSSISKTITDQLLVKDDQFAKQPFLSNSVQQFALWLISCAATLQEASSSHGRAPITFTFHFSDAIELCLTLQSPNLFEPLDCETLFDLVYTSNLIDHLAPPNLVLTVLPLVKSGGHLFTSTLLYKSIAVTAKQYIEMFFGLDIKLLPVVLGVRCINHEGDGYSSDISVQPMPFEFGDYSRYAKVFIWEKTVGLPLKHPSLLNRSNIIIKNLCHAVCKSTTSLVTESPKGQRQINHICTETAMQILLSFANRIEGDISDHHFWKPLCSLLLQKDELKPFIQCLQTQALLHDLHLHLNLDEHMCPVCQQAPLTDYLGQFSVETSVSSELVSPNFLVFLYETSKTFECVEQLMVALDPSIHIIDSLNGIMTENGLAL